jgi:hypothetical protein
MPIDAEQVARIERSEIRDQASNKLGEINRGAVLTRVSP